MKELLRYAIFDDFEDLIVGTTLKSLFFPYNFSLALHTGEDEGDIIANRKELQKFSNDCSFVVANQTHSDHIVIIDEQKSCGWMDQESAIKDCDALLTSQENVILGVLTADCVPVLFYDSKQKVVGAVHAGWKGTRKNIVQKSVQKMQTYFGSEAKDIYALVAPSIGVCCYEVGRDVADNFGDEVKCLQHNGKYMLDLKQANLLQLLNIGLKRDHIEISAFCTSCDNERFFSYRKEQGCSGRFLSFIGMHRKKG